MEKPPEADISIYSKFLEGHRRAYLSFARSLLNGDRASRRVIASSAAPALFLMIEEGILSYVLLGLMRAAFGCRTVGLLFRPEPALARSNLRQRLKYRLLRAIKPVPHLKTLTILPFAISPRFGEIADGWIHDFQLWDLGENERQLVAGLPNAAANIPGDALALYREARRRAGGKKVLVALGTQSIGKGLGTLAAAVEAGATKGWFLLVVGEVAGEMAQPKTVIEAANGWVVDKLASDAELFAGYAIADAVWCCYDESYDQASGILGRAAQLGRPAVVRKGSLSEALCLGEYLTHVALDRPTDLARLLCALPAPDPVAGRILTTRLREANVERLQCALGMTPAKSEATRRKCV